MKRNKLFLDILENNVLVCDGAMGTMIYSKGIYINRNYDELNLSAADLIKRIHEEYIQAGAEIIETNTFGANRFKLAEYALEKKVREINLAGVQLAKEAAQDKVFVAGSIGPLGKLLQPRGPIKDIEAKEAFSEQISALAEGGVDVFIIETMSDLKEITIAITAAKEIAPHIPIIAQMTFTEEIITSAGYSPEEVISAIEKLDVAVVGVNCSAGPQSVLDALERMINASSRNLYFSAQPNAGLPRIVEGRTLYLATPEYLAEYARRYVLAGVSIVGGCCGTTPNHIRAIKQMVKMLKPQKVKPISIPVEISIEEAAPTTKFVEKIPLEEKSALAKKLTQGKFVISVELDPPKGPDVSKILDGAKKLEKIGIDAVNIADSPRAMPRMSPITLAVLISQETSLETIVHVTCRDRNLLGLQSDLLGAFALGIRNILSITGDPPKLGDYPNATAVYDVDAIGLVQLLNSLNLGKDLAGNTISPATRFFIGVGVDPNAIDFDREFDRLSKKIEAGAEFIMTQPVYEPDTLEHFFEEFKKLNKQIPILVGILPLRSYKHAEFLHNEVPGMSIPEKIRERIRKAGTNAAVEGILIAREAFQYCRKNKDKIAGVYIMPPFNKYEVVLEILETV